MDVLLIGGGGHCVSVIDVLESEDRFKIAGVIEAENSVATHVMGYPVIGSDYDLPELMTRFKQYIVTVGQIRSGALRRQLAEKVIAAGGQLVTTVSPSAYISSRAMIDKGTFIGHGAVINSNAIIATNCIINSQALIEHDVSIGANSHVSTGALVNGGVTVEDGCFVGSGAIVREQVRIGANSFVGAGVFVHKDLPPNSYVKRSV